MIKNILAKTLLEKQMVKRDLVKLTNLDNYTVDKLFNGETSRVSLSILDKLCFALRCDTNEIFKYISD